MLVSVLSRISSVKLDVGGAMIVRGNTIVSRSGKCYFVHRLTHRMASTFTRTPTNSSTKTTTNPYFFVAERTGRQQTPLLLRQPSTCDIPGPEPKPRPAFTSIRTAQFHFAPNQTFPGGTGVSSVALSAPSSDFTVQRLTSGQKSGYSRAETGNVRADQLRHAERDCEAR